MAPKKEPSGKVLDKHAKFLAAWEAAGFPDKFEYEGTSFVNVRSTAEWYREQNKRPPRTRPFCSPAAIAAVARPLFRHPRRPHSDAPVSGELAARAL